ncbi:hypothetical protein H072_10873 [Dactylellina haptotyla CBS 200.50]|uniref:G-patch domain-containing protein n=1 Tax=Dactylellina haptotyla (strain CBS 200.50) TaxID=1284197 RepID=S7ZZ23_DACHA|nr:hypothetical protein H072_10873 [Dactylellina haptotyla CBS 200.50]
MAANTGRGMTSLYADLLEPDSVKKDQQQSILSKTSIPFPPGDATKTTQDTAGVNDQPVSAKKQLSSTALRFQPVPRRPQPTLQKPVKRVGANTFTKQLRPEALHDQAESAALTTRAPVVKSTLEDWAKNEDDDVNGFYSGVGRQRGGRKRRKKNKDKEFEKTTQGWDDIYDPSRPNLYEEYKESEEKDHEIREWRDRLYGRRRAFSSDYSEDDERPSFSGKSFAPPPNLNQAITQEPQIKPDPLFEAETGDEIWTLRARLTEKATETSGAASYSRTDIQSSTSPIVQYRSNKTQDLPEMAGDGISNPSTIHKNPTISRAPIIYSLPPAPPDIASESADDDIEVESNDTDPPADCDGGRSVRPGQKGFAERLMSKYGWTKGTGLGANSSGMVHALQVRATKGKDSKGVGKILDKNKRRDGEETGKFGKMSEVVVLHKMVDGLESEDLAVLMQEIGDECSEKYGRIERVHIIHKQLDNTSSKVFVQFTSQLSALRSLSEEEQKLFRLYGKLPSKKDILSNKLKERKYFDSGDYALSKAGKASDVGVTQIGSKHPLPENIPHSHNSTGSAAGTPSGSMSSGVSGAPVKEGLLLKKSTSPEPESEVAVQESGEDGEPTVPEPKEEENKVPMRWRSQS